jgi:hypothetical protein
MYCPDIDVAVSTSIDQTLDDSAHGSNASRRKLMEGLATVLDSALDQGATAKSK